MFGPAQVASRAGTAVLSLASWVFGPLAGPECRRALARGWLILVRGIAAVAMLGVVALALWSWWINQSLDVNYQPYYEPRVGLIVVEGMLVTISLVFGPAVMAGSLAGERERGALGLLLTTRVSPREIVVGRLAGKLSQLGMILLAGMPAVVLLATLSGAPPVLTEIDLLLPVAIGIGAGGLAALASIISRRGRDALLLVYLVESLMLLGPLFRGLGFSGTEWLALANPYAGFEALIFQGDFVFTLETAAVWIALGLLGTALATWRLRPTCLGSANSDRIRSKKGRSGFVPPVDERRPMVWKELFIERVGTLGKIGVWFGRLLIIALIGGPIVLMGLWAWNANGSFDLQWKNWVLDELQFWVGGSGALLSCLIQLAIGLRAGVTISSERERGTWDALLTSPLTGDEIVRGKLSGSFYALRGLILASLLAWGISAAVDALELRNAITWTGEVFVIGAFMAAVGVRASLTCQTATRAMALTMGIWLGAYVLVAFTSLMMVLIGLLLLNALRIAAAQVGLVVMQTGIWSPVPWPIAYPLARASSYLFITFLIVLDTGLRFDRLAGRMTEGKASLAFGELVHGRPVALEWIETTEDLDAIGKTEEVGL